MSKFHINPETGKPNRCTAKKKCKYAVDGVEPKHYNSFEAAAKDYERANSNKTLESLKKESKDVTDTASMPYIKSQGYEKSTDAYEKYAILQYGKGDLSDGDKGGRKAARKIEESFANKNYLSYDMTRAYVVSINGENNSDLYISDEDGHFIGGALNIPNDDLLKASERLNIRRQLFDDGWEKESSISKKANGVPLLRDPAPKVKIDSLNDKFTDDDIDRIIEKARETNVDSEVVSYSSTIVRIKNDGAADEWIDLKSRKAEGISVETQNNNREFLTFMKDLSSEVKNR